MREKNLFKERAFEDFEYEKRFQENMEKLRRQQLEFDRKQKECPYRMIQSLQEQYR